MSSIVAHALVFLRATCPTKNKSVDGIESLFSSAFRTETSGGGYLVFAVRANFQHQFWTQQGSAEIAVGRVGGNLTPTSRTNQILSSR